MRARRGKEDGRRGRVESNPSGFLPARANSRKETEDATVSVLKPTHERSTGENGASERRTFMVVRERRSEGADEVRGGLEWMLVCC